MVLKSTVLFVLIYSILADNHGNLDSATERVKNDNPNLNSLGLMPLASYCMAFINFIIGWRLYGATIA